MTFINHQTWVLDASSSMVKHTSDVIKVVDSQIRALGDRSKFSDQETRVSVFTFSSPQYHDNLMAKNLVWDTDVLRAPSISGLYKPHGNTALCTAMVKVLTDLRTIPEPYGDHANLLWLVTDGEENSSSGNDIRSLPSLIKSLPGNWTLAAFVPGIQAKTLLAGYGFPSGNIEVWDPSKQGAIEEVGIAMAAATDDYRAMRARGVKSTTSLFAMNAPRVSDLKKSLVPMTSGSYWFESVTAEDLAKITNGRIDEFMALKTGTPYTPGRAYYEMTKRERIQPYKKIAVAIWDRDTNAEQVYVGDNARKMLGLPDTEVRVSPGSFKGYKVHILSTSMNRKLQPGTRVLVMR
jgi:hypothetical protein